MNEHGPDGPQELYWLSRSVERFTEIVERMSKRLDVLEARLNLDDALAKEKNERRSRYKKWFDTAIVGGAGWLIRDLLDLLKTLAAHMRHP